MKHNRIELKRTNDGKWYPLIQIVAAGPRQPVPFATMNSDGTIKTFTARKDAARSARNLFRGIRDRNQGTVWANFPEEKL